MPIGNCNYINALKLCWKTHLNAWHTNAPPGGKMGGGKWKSGKVATLGLRPSVCCCLSVCHLALIINNIINHLQQLRLSVLVSMISRRVLNALEINICNKIISYYTNLNTTKWSYKNIFKRTVMDNFKTEKYLSKQYNIISIIFIPLISPCVDSSSLSLSLGNCWQ